MSSSSKKGNYFLMNLQAIDIVNLLGLKELPEEGGYFNITYQSTQVVELERGNRALGDCIYYLITEDQFSGLHKLKCDEIWHFYAGDPVDMLIFSHEEFQVRELGNVNLAVHRPQQLVKADQWQGAKLKDGGKWALLGTNAFPGYEQSDFVLGKIEMFIDMTPEQFSTVKSYVK